MANSRTCHTSTRIKLGTLPRDMREELFNLHATSVNPNATEAAFNRTDVPICEIDISKIDTGYDRNSTHSYDGLTMPPIVIADHKLIDGGHRIASAQRRKINTLHAIDMTGMLDPKVTGSIADLPKAKRKQPTRKVRR